MSLPKSNGVVPDWPNSTPGQPQVRHIPIFVEGRDEPLLNTNMGDQTQIPHNYGSNHHLHTSSSMNRQTPPQDLKPQASGGPSSIFSRVKNFPVRTGFDNEFSQGHQLPGSRPFAQRANSPDQTITVNTAARPTTQSSAADSSIGKIQSIQRDVLALMDQVEQFAATSKRDKQYLYLDEMLTQNLLKLDTIDTEGKENIKQARREAIKCINICIAALERKAGAVESDLGQ